MKNCKFCSEQIHPKRLEILPNAETCVKCSTTGKKAGVTVTVGKGDHTYNDIVIMEPEDFNKYSKSINQEAFFDDEIKSFLSTCSWNSSSVLTFISLFIIKID